MPVIPTDRRITVTGEAQREFTPDVARWTFDVTGTGDTEADALASCIERTGAVLVALREEFGADVVVSTGTTSLYEAYDEDPDFEESPTARASVSAKLLADLAGRAAPVAVAAGARGAHGPKWELAEAQRVRHELLVESFRAAQHKARLLADAADSTLGDVIELREGADGYFSDAEYLAAEVAGPDVPVASPTPTLTAAVTVTFALSAAPKT